jgi:hypothetical protein
MVERNLTITLKSSNKLGIREYRDHLVIYTGDETNSIYQHEIYHVVNRILENHNRRSTTVWIETRSQFHTAKMLAMLARGLNFTGFYETSEDVWQLIPDHTPSDES